MNKFKLLASFVLLVYVLFVVFQFSGSNLIAQNLRSLIFPLVALTYFLCTKDKSIFFVLFLILYSLSDILSLFLYDKHVDYLVGNLLYILAYIMLLIEICKFINLPHILKNFKVHLIVLTALNIYIVYILQLITDPHILVSYEYFIEIIYNVVMLLLLSSSLLNYFHKGNKKSLYLFVGSLCVVFSEVINVAYLYVAQQSLLNFISTTLGLLAFYFLYQQSTYDNTEDMNVLANY